MNNHIIKSDEQNTLNALKIKASRKYGLFTRPGEKIKRMSGTLRQKTKPEMM
jgi:hypothetical protein